MIPDRINAKIFLTETAEVELAAVIPLFHRWIRERAVTGLLLDVADYKHVQDGPGVLLIGHEGDYALDLTHGRPGLLYRHKREWGSDDLQERLRLVLGRLLPAAYLLEQEETLGRLTFATNELELAFHDQLHTPNTPEMAALLRSDVAAALPVVYGDARVSLSHVYTDARRPLTFRITVQQAPDLAILVGRVDRLIVTAYER